MTMEIKITTINANGLQKNLRKLEKFVQDNNGHIICIQETHNVDKNAVNTWAEMLGYHIIWNAENISRLYGGTAIMVRSQIKDAVKNHRIIEKNRAHAVDISLWDKFFTLINVYAPSGNYTERRHQRLQFFTTIGKYIETIPTSIILVGDFNNVLTAIDSKNQTAFYLEPAATALKRILDTNRLRDTFRTKHGKQLIYTHKHVNQSRRIDRIYHTIEIEASIIETGHQPNLVSDHMNSPYIAIRVGPEGNSKKRGWKCNNKLLKDECYTKIIENLYETLENQKENFHNIQEWWDHTKRKVAKVSKSYAINLSNNEDQESNSERLRVMAGEPKLEDQEQSNRLFWAYMKTRMDRTKITSLETTTGKVTSDPVVITKEVKDFYHKLWGEKANIIHHMQDKYLEDFQNDSPEDGNKLDCGTLVSLTEIQDTIQNMKKEKSPGTDGITVEFYLTFWKSIKYHLRDIINNAILFSKIPQSWKEAKVTLVHKKLDKTKIGNYRPISLLNTDYKIMAKILNNRIKEIVTGKIGHHQKAAVPGRKIHDVHYNINAVINCLNARKQDGYIMTMDYKKAFDSINQEMMFKILQKLDIPERIMHLLKEIYSGATAQVEVNGIYTDKIKIQRGIRQGCPLSMTLYAVCMEPLTRKIIQNNNIRGITMGHYTQKLDQYADDTTLTIGDINSITEIFKEYDRLQRATGQEINDTKTEILPLNKNSEKNLSNSIYNKYAKKTIKILGVHYGENANQKIYDEIQSKINRDIGRIKHRKITWLGKIKAISSIIIPKVTYVAKATCLTKRQVKELEKSIFQLLWHPEKIEQKRRTVLIQAKEHGGIAMMDIQSKIDIAKLEQLTILEQLENITEFWHKEAIYNLGSKIKSIKIGLYRNDIPHRDTPTKEWQEKINVRKAIMENQDIAIDELTAKRKYEILVEKRSEGMVEEKQNWQSIWLLNKGQGRHFCNEERVLSYRINNEAYLTGYKKMIYKWKNTSRGITTPIIKCKLCKKEKDTMSHIFLDCIVYRDLHNSIKKKAENILREKLTFTQLDIMENTFNGKHHRKILKLFMEIKQLIIKTHTNLDIENEYADNETTRKLKENTTRLTDETLT